MKMNISKVFAFFAEFYCSCLFRLFNYLTLIYLLVKQICLLNTFYRCERICFLFEVGLHLFFIRGNLLVNLKYVIIVVVVV